MTDIPATQPAAVPPPAPAIVVNGDRLDFVPVNDGAGHPVGVDVVIGSTPGRIIAHIMLNRDGVKAARNMLTQLLGQLGGGLSVPTPADVAQIVNGGGHGRG